MIRTERAGAVATAVPAEAAKLQENDSTDEEEDVDDEGSEEEEDESSEGSVGSLVDFIQDKIEISKAKSRTADIVPENIVTGKRVRKPVQKYVDKRYGSLMTADIPPEEMEVALADKTDSEEEEDKSLPSDDEYEEDEDSSEESTSDDDDDCSMEEEEDL